LAKRQDGFDQQAGPAHLFEKMCVGEGDTIVGADLHEVAGAALAEDLPQDSVFTELSAEVVQDRVRPGDHP